MPYKIIYTGLPTKFQYGYSLETNLPKDSNENSVIVVYEKFSTSYRFYFLDNEYNKKAIFKINLVDISDFLNNNVLNSSNFNILLEKSCDYLGEISIENNVKGYIGNEFLNYNFNKYHNGYYKNDYIKLFKYVNSCIFYRLVELFCNDETIKNLILNENSNLNNHKYIDPLVFINNNLNSEDNLIDTTNLLNKIDFDIIEHKTLDDKFLTYFSQVNNNLYVSFFLPIIYKFHVRYNGSFVFDIELPILMQLNIIYNIDYEDIIYRQYNIVNYLSFFSGYKYLTTGIRSFSFETKSVIDLIVSVKNENLQDYMLAIVETLNPYNDNELITYQYTSSTEKIPYFYFDKENKIVFKQSLYKNEEKVLYIVKSSQDVKQEDPNNIFEFFDDFDGNELDSTKWDDSQASSYSIENSYIKMWGAWDGKQIISINTFTFPIKVIWKAKCSTSGDIDNILGIYKDSNNYIFHNLENDTCSSWYCYCNISSKISGNEYYSTNNKRAGTEWRNCISYFTTSYTKFYIEGVDEIILNKNFSSLDNFKIFISGDTDSSSRFAYKDYIAVCKLVEPEPTIEILESKNNYVKFKIKTQNAITDYQIFIDKSLIPFDNFEIYNENITAIIKKEITYKPYLLTNNDLKNYIIDRLNNDDNPNDIIKFSILLPKYKGIAPIPIDKQFKLDFSIPLAMVFD